MKASILLQDSHGRQTRKSLGLEATTLAQAIIDVNAFLTNLATIIDLQCVSVTYSQKDTTGAFAGESASNVDVGATFQGLLTNGNGVSLHIPGLADSCADSAGSVDIADSDVAAVLAHFLTAGTLTISDGQTVASWVKGFLDK